MKFGDASPLDGIDAGRFFFERRQYAESENALVPAMALLKTEIQRARGVLRMPMWDSAHL